MPTGACGINCDVCGLKQNGTCPGCMAGTMWQAEMVKDHPCPVLKCAVEKKVEHCLSSCGEFPCQMMEQTNYPYSAGYIGMHRQRSGK